MSNMKIFQNGNDYYTHTFDSDEFAKLLIEECSKTMCERDSFYGKWMGEIIKNHFGVEE